MFPTQELWFDQSSLTNISKINRDQSLFKKRLDELLLYSPILLTII